ncbi:TonB-dependent siderophore receptor [Xanthobacter autotrophicus DSM 431]|uniref:TonB-dependent siderophore receptor n=1 Tax=Xanthobacter nonsaccharivorans TaxID=3119912 RepID=UPI0037274B86
MSTLSTVLAATAICALDFAIAPHAAAEEATDTVSLPTVTVDGTRESAWGPVGGYVATRSAAGTKTDTPLIETPRSISVVTRQEMDDRAAQNVVDAISYTAGVVTGAYGYDPRFDDIYIRGFAVTSRGDFMNGLSQFSGNFAYWRTETYGLERIDIIKGPAGVLYGQTVPGGLINRISKMPVDTPFAEIEGQVGAPDWFQAAFDVGGKLKEDGSALYRLTGVARAAEGTVEYTTNNALYLAPAFTFQNDSTRLTILTNVLDIRLPASTYYYQPDNILTKIPVGTTYNAINQTQEQAGYILEHDFDDIWSAKQNLRYGHIDNHSFWLFPTGTRTGPLVDVYAANYRETLDTFQVDNQVQARFQTGPIKHKVLGGLDYMWGESSFGDGYGFNAAPINIFNADTPNLVAMPAITSASGASLSQLGLYVQDQMSFGDGWHFTLGGRQDFATEDQSAYGITAATRDDQAFTWQAGLLYEFPTGVSPYVSYATSFLPSLNVDAAGQLLEPSTGEQYEAGLKFQPKGGRSFFTLAAYQITQNNYAVPDPVTFYYSPVGNVRVRGFEAEAFVELAEGLDLTAAYTFTQGKIINSLDVGTIGNVPVNMPANVASLWAKYTFLSGPLKGFGVGAGIRYYSGFWANNENTYKNPSQFPVDAALYYEKDSWKLALNAKNVFGQQEALNNEGYWYWQQGRTVLASVKYHW